MVISTTVVVVVVLASALMMIVVSVVVPQDWSHAGRSLFSLSTPIDGALFWKEAVWLRNYKSVEAAGGEGSGNTNVVGICLLSPLLWFAGEVGEGDFNYSEWRVSCCFAALQLATNIVWVAAVALLYHQRAKRGWAITTATTVAAMGAVAFNPLFLCAPILHNLSTVQHFVATVCLFGLILAYDNNNKKEKKRLLGQQTVGLFLCLGCIIVLTASHFPFLALTACAAPALYKMAAERKSATRISVRTAMVKFLSLVVALFAVVVAVASTLFSEDGDISAVLPQLSGGVPRVIPPPSIGVRWYMQQMLLPQFEDLFTVILELFPVMMALPLSFKIFSSALVAAEKRKERKEGKNREEEEEEEEEEEWKVAGVVSFAVIHGIVTVHKEYVTLQEYVFAAALVVISIPIMTRGAAATAHRFILENGGGDDGEMKKRGVLHYKFVVVLAAATAVVMAHVFYYAWLVQAVANGNFLFFTNLALAGAMVLLLIQALYTFLHARLRTL